MWHHNWHQYVWTSLCQFIFFLWTSSIVHVEAEASACWYHWTTSSDGHRQYFKTIYGSERHMNRKDPFYKKTGMCFLLDIQDIVGLTALGVSQVLNINKYFVVFTIFQTHLRVLACVFVYLQYYILSNFCWYSLKAAIFSFIIISVHLATVIAWASGCSCASNFLISSCNVSSVNSQILIFWQIVSTCALSAILSGNCLEMLIKIGQCKCSSIS